MIPNGEERLAEDSKWRFVILPTRRYRVIGPIYEEGPKFQSVPVRGGVLRGVENTPAGDYSINTPFGRRK
jgi:hypothetical protein